MLKSKWLCRAAIVAGSVAAAASASAHSFTTFDPQGSIYTFPTAINGSGTVAGYYEDTSGMMHGFMRASDGTITTFDPKGSTYTEALSINSVGEVTGWYRAASGTYYSFVRATDGTITKFNPTNGNMPGTMGLNGNGNVTGGYTNGSRDAGYVGTPGKTKQLTVEGVAINIKGAVTGLDGTKGFVRSASGKTTTFVAPGNAHTTVPTSINDSGVVAGYGASVCGISRTGFARSGDGKLTSIAPPNSEDSQVTGINNKDDLAGYYYYNGYHGFVRGAGGAYTTFDVTGATYGTYPQSINATRQITGYYEDSNGMMHGFVGTP